MKTIFRATTSPVRHQIDGVQPGTHDPVLAAHTYHQIDTWKTVNSVNSITSCPDPKLGWISQAPQPLACTRPVATFETHAIEHVGNALDKDPGRVITLVHPTPP